MSPENGKRAAVITLCSGYQYEGDVEVAGPFVHFSGRRRIGHGRDVSYYPTNDHTWPHGRIDSIRWLESDRVAA